MTKLDFNSGYVEVYSNPHEIYDALTNRLMHLMDTNSAIKALGPEVINRKENVSNEEVIKEKGLTLLVFVNKNDDKLYLFKDKGNELKPYDGKFYTISLNNPDEDFTELLVEYILYANDNPRLLSLIEKYNLRDLKLISDMILHYQSDIPLHEMETVRVYGKKLIFDDNDGIRLKLDVDSGKLRLGWGKLFMWIYYPDDSAVIDNRENGKYINGRTIIGHAFINIEDAKEYKKQLLVNEIHAYQRRIDKLTNNLKEIN